MSHLHVRQPGDLGYREAFPCGQNSPVGQKMPDTGIGKNPEGRGSKERLIQERRCIKLSTIPIESRSKRDYIKLSLMNQTRLKPQDKN